MDVPQEFLHPVATHPERLGRERLERVAGQQGPRARHVHGIPAGIHAGRLEDHRQCPEPRMPHQMAKTVSTDRTRADVLMAVDA